MGLRGSINHKGTKLPALLKDIVKIAVIIDGQSFTRFRLCSEQGWDLLVPAKSGCQPVVKNHEFSHDRARGRILRNQFKGQGRIGIEFYLQFRERQAKGPFFVSVFTQTVAYLTHFSKHPL